MAENIDQGLKVEADLGSTPQQMDKLRDLFNQQADAIGKFIDIATKLDSRLDQMANSLKDFQTAYQSQVQAQIAADQKMSESAEKMVERRRNALKNSRKDVDAAIAASKGPVPTDASASELSALEAARQRLARVGAEGPIAGGRLETMTLALKTAGQQAIDMSDKLAKVKLAALEVSQSYDNLGESAKRAQEKADAAAARQAERLQRQADTNAQRAAKTPDPAIAAKRLQDAADVSDLAGNLKPSGTFSAIDTAKFEIPAKRLAEFVRKTSSETDVLKKVLEDLGTTGSASFAGLSSKTEGWVKQLLTARENLIKLSAPDASVPLAERIEQASRVLDNFRAKFSTSLSSQGLNTSGIDQAVEKLTLMVRTGAVSENRVNEISKAIKSGSLVNLTGEITAADKQAITLIERISKLYLTAVDGAVNAAVKQHQYNTAIAAAKPAIDQILGTLANQFGAITDPGRFLQLQSAVNQLFNTMARGKTDAKQLLEIFQQLNASGGGKGGGGAPPTILTPDAGGEAQRQLLRLIQLFQQTEAAGVKSGKAIFLTWESVIRIFQVQVLHQVIGQLIASMRQAEDRAVQFQIKISEIRTISQDAQLTTQQWAAGLRDLSDAFGLPILDVTKAAYDAISNQVTRGAQTFEFLRTTLEFARTTVSSSADAQNLLSSAIKSYGEQNLTASRAAEVLFATIDVGRVTASELANTFGRVAQISATVGIKFEELNAAIATLTVRGVRYSEAYTLINNVTLKLLKPTEEMRNLMLKWGVATGEAAIQTFGFVGVLRLLQKELESGGAARIGELEKDIRAIRGALGLINQDAFANFEQDLEQITNSAEKFKHATEIIRESAGFKLQQDLNKITNLLTTDFASDFVNSIVEMVKPFDGFSGLVKDTLVLLSEFTTQLKNLSQPVLALAEAINRIGGADASITVLRRLIQGYVAYQVALLAVAAAQKALVAIDSFLAARMAANVIATDKVTFSTNAMALASTTASKAKNALAASVGIVTAALTAGIFVYSEITSKVDAATASLTRHSEALRENAKNEELANLEKSQQASVDAFKKSDEETFKKVNFAIAGATIQLSQFLDLLKNTDQAKLSDIKSQAEGVFNFIEKRQTELKDFISNIDREIEKSNKRVIDIQEHGKTKQLENSLGLASDIQRADIIQKQVTLLKEELATQLSLNRARSVKVEFKSEGLLPSAPGLTSIEFNNIAQAQQHLDRLLAEGRDKTDEAIQLRKTLATIDIITPEVLETARNRYDEIIKLTQRQLEQTESAFRSQEKLVAQLDAKSDRKAFERSLIGKSGAESTLLTLNKVEGLRGRALKLFDNGDLEESRRLFEEIDNLLQKMFDKQKSFREKAQKLGVVFATPLVGGPLDTTINRNDQDRKKLEVDRLTTLKSQYTELATTQKNTTRELIELEKQFSEQQRRRFEQAKQAQIELNNLQKIAQELASGRLGITGAFTDATNRQKQGLSDIVTETEKSRELLSDQSKGTDTGFLFNAQAFNNILVKAGFEEMIKTLDKIKTNPQDVDNLIKFSEQLQHVKADMLAAVTDLKSVGFLTKETETEQKRGVDDFVTQLRDSLLKIAEARNKVKTASGDINEAQNAENRLKERANEISRQHPEFEAAAKQIGDILGPQSKLETFSSRLATQFERVSTAMERFAEVLNNIPNINPGAIPRRALGGPIGSDTGLFWGDPREVVVNATSSRRFASELRSINMGFEPTSSGSGQAISVGDVNVTVQGGNKSSETMGREIGEAIRRDLRRGILKLS